MTTITNFLQGNFIEQQNLQEKETPIWVLLSETNTISSTALPLLKRYMVQESVNNNRPLLHVDLGLSTLRSAQEATEIKEFDNCLYKMHESKPHYLMRWNANQRRKPNSLKQFVASINSIHTSEFMKAERTQNKLSEKIKNSMGLIVEGIELAATLPSRSNELEQFIGSLGNLHPNFKQITIIINLPELLSKEHRFALQRISSCLTDIEQSSKNREWVCTSTVRRYTGFSNEQRYLIRQEEPKQGRLKVKVEKYQKKREQGETEAQKQMISALGFGIKKDINEPDQNDSEEIKKMIYPHLRVRDQLIKGESKRPQCSKCDVSHCPGCEGDQDLIILDDEQEDQDDVDV